MLVRGGSSVPSYFVYTTAAGGEDADRGIRGTPSDTAILLSPRPTLTRVSGASITRQSAILQAGDYQLNIAGQQISEAQLRDTSARIRVGTEEFRIVHYDPKYVDGSVAYYVVFVRGAVS
jgi:hypothetical protein